LALQKGIKKSFLYRRVRRRYLLVVDSRNMGFPRSAASTIKIKKYLSTKSLPLSSFSQSVIPFAETRAK